MPEIKERPILFSAPMVRAILAGQKTMTRRVVKFPEPSNRLGVWEPTIVGGNGVYNDHGNPAKEEAAIWHTRTGQTLLCPHGKVGDRLWVRETHAQVFEVDIPEGRPVGPIGSAGSPARPDWKSRYVYRSDGEMPNVQRRYVGDSSPVGWTPSIFMPRRASRMLLEITSIRVERLQDITDRDICAEGFSGAGTFAHLWDKLNAKRGCGWDTNPFVWVIEFRRVIQ